MSIDARQDTQRAVIDGVAAEQLPAPMQGTCVKGDAGGGDGSDDDAMRRFV